MPITITGAALVLLVILPFLTAALIPHVSISIVYWSSLSNFGWMDKTTDKSCTETVVPEVSTHLLMNQVTFFGFALPKIYYILTCSWMPVSAFNTTLTLSVFMILTDFGITAENGVHGERAGRHRPRTV